MAPKDLDKLIEKYLQGKCTREESDFVNNWYSALGKHPGSLSNNFEDKVSSAESRILKNLQTRVQVRGEEPLEEERPRSFIWQYSGIAASLILCLSIGYYFLREDVSALAAKKDITPVFASVENFNESVKRVILPDGSIVEMRPDSKIRFSKDLQTPSRELFLEGEAYFDVARDTGRPFFVFAGEIVTKVLGTTFVIRAVSEDEKVTVSVKTGKVTVYSMKTSHKKTVLSPNQEAVYDMATDVVATQPTPEQSPGEVKKNFNEMHFEESPVSEVLGLLTRTYDIDIIFRPETLSGCVLTSSFYEEGLYDRIDVICTAIGATYKIVDAQIIIESNGCNLKP